MKFTVAAYTSAASRFRRAILTSILISGAAFYYYSQVKFAVSSANISRMQADRSEI